MQIQTDFDIELLEEIVEEVQDVDLWQLVLFNDPINTFDYVITTLIEVCEHTPEQAEQCTLLVHYKGKCGVKSGEFEGLAKMRKEICRRGILAEVMLK